MLSRRWILTTLESRETPTVFGNPWLDPNLTLSFVPNHSTNSQEILRAFQAWANVANINIGVVPDGGQPLGVAGPTQRDPRFGDIRVSTAPLADDAVALALPFDVTAGTRAGDVLFNSSKPFGVGHTAEHFDWFSVALHEAGHVLGLEGNTDPSSAMFQHADRTHAGISDLDRANVQKLYGPRQPDANEGATGNETTSTATRLQPTDSNGQKLIRTTADLTTANDTDVYLFKVEAENNQATILTLQTAGRSLLVAGVEVLDASGRVVANRTGDGTLRLTTLERGREYFVRVKAADATFAIGQYRLEIQPETSSSDDPLDDDERGSNDSPNSSESLSRLPSLGGTRQNFAVRSSLSSATDVDFFRVRPSQPSGTSAGVLTVSVAGVGIDPIVEVYDRNFVRVPLTILSHDAGEFSGQVAETEGNRDYFVAVRQTGTATGNYTLGMDFGGPLAALTAFGAGELTAAAPATTTPLHVQTSEVFHLVLTTEPTPTPAAVRVSLFNAQNVAVDSRIVTAGQSVSFNSLLPQGEYQILVGGGSTDSSAMPAIRYQLRGVALSDPVGPRAIDPLQPIDPVAPPTVPPPPPVVIGSPRPATPPPPTSPSPPNILLQPPSEQPTSPTLRLKPVAPPPTRSTAISTGSTVRSLNTDGTERLSFQPFPNFTGSIRVAEADFNSDGIADIVAATGPGAASEVVVFDGALRSVIQTIRPFEPSFRGGVYVTAGDVTGDGRADVTITPDEGGGPRVRVFDAVDYHVVADFFGIDDPNFRGGSRATVGDLNADGVGDIVVAAGFAGGPRVASYDGAKLAAGQFVKLFGDFFAFEASLRNGSYVALGDVTGDGFADLVAGGGPGGGPRVMILDGQALLQNQYRVVSNFFAGDVRSRAGVRVAVKRLDDDAKADVVVAVGDTASSQILGFTANSLALGSPIPDSLSLTNSSLAVG